MNWFLVMMIVGQPGMIWLPFKSEQACQEALKSLHAQGDMPKRMVFACKPGAK